MHLQGSSSDLYLLGTYNFRSRLSVHEIYGVSKYCGRYVLQIILDLVRPCGCVYQVWPLNQILSMQPKNIKKEMNRFPYHNCRNCCERVTFGHTQREAMFHSRMAMTLIASRKQITIPSGCTPYSSYKEVK